MSKIKSGRNAEIVSRYQQALFAWVVSWAVNALFVAVLLGADQLQYIENRYTAVGLSGLMAAISTGFAIIMTIWAIAGPKVVELSPEAEKNLGELADALASTRTVADRLGDELSALHAAGTLDRVDRPRE